MQHVAAYVLNEPPEVVEHIARSRRLHRATAIAAHARLVAAGISCRPPAGGFYLYPDFEPVRPQLGRARTSTAAMRWPRTCSSASRSAC